MRIWSEIHMDFHVAHVTIHVDLARNPHGFPCGFGAKSMWIWSEIHVDLERFTLGFGAKSMWIWSEIHMDFHVDLE